MLAVSFADESNAERDNRIDATIRAAGFKPVYDDQCPSGVKGYFSSNVPAGAPAIVVCINNHEGTGDMAHTQAHEMAHAAQYCLARRGLVLSDIFDITKQVIAEWRSYQRVFRDLDEQQIQRLRREQAMCARNMIPNKIYCNNIPRRLEQLQQEVQVKDPILVRADSGEKLSLPDLVGIPDLRAISELYQPKDQYLELEARAFAFLGRDAALKAIAVACGNAKNTSKD